MSVLLRQEVMSNDLAFSEEASVRQKSEARRDISPRGAEIGGKVSKGRATHRERSDWW